MESIQQNEIIVLVARTLAGLAAPEETAKLNVWISLSESNRRYFNQISNIWDASYRQIDPGTINTPEALKKVLDRLPTITRKRRFWFYLQKIAAVILLPLVVGSFLLGYHDSLRKADISNEFVYNNVYAPYGTRSSFKLSDSTLVWLNSGSSLKFPVRFNKNIRKVFLTGEAYFEVKSNASQPFIVQTSALQIKATGTRFNVQSYSSRSATEVTLASGKVFVKGTGNNKNSHAILELNPDQHLVYNNNTSQNNIIDGDSYKYIAWKDGKLIFRNEPLKKVLDEIGLIFNVDIELQGKELQNYRYHATFEDESLEEILKLLRISAPIGYKEVPRSVLPDGSFTKKKVIIYPASRTLNNEPNV